MTAILEPTVEPVAIVEPAPRPCAARLLAPTAGGDVCPTYGGEFCPSDQKLIDACSHC